MSLNDPLANVLSHINNAEHQGKRVVNTKSNNKFIREVLLLLQNNQYLGSHEVVKEPRGSKLVINLLGTINTCGAVKPRFSVDRDEYEKFEKRFLPAKGFGILVMSTSNGLMTHEQAKEKGLGGRLIAYCY